MTAGVRDGVRRRLGAAERRELILDAARAQFAEVGFDAATTREIAARAGVTDAMIYRHFASKNELLSALVDRLTGEFAAMEPGELPIEVPLGRLLQTIGARFVWLLSANRDLLVLLVAQPGLRADDRLVRFIDGAAEALGRRIDAETGGTHRSVSAERGYIVARGFMGSLAAQVLLHDVLGMNAVHPLVSDDYVTTMAQVVAAGVLSTGAPGAVLGSEEGVAVGG